MATVIRIPHLDGSYQIVRGKFYQDFRIDIDTKKPIEFWGNVRVEDTSEKYWVHIRIENSASIDGKSDVLATVAYYWDLEMAVEVATQMTLLWNKYVQKKVVDIGELLREAESIYHKTKEGEMWKVSQEAKETAEKLGQEISKNEDC